jgi:DNA-binding MarR family transcriptional regulator
MAKDMSFTLQLAVTNAFVSRLFDIELIRLGVEPAQAGVLSLIALHEPLTPTALEEVSGLPGGTLRERVRSLESDGYVRRSPNPDDGRSYFIQTTPVGKRFLEVAEPVVRRIEKAIEKETGMPLRSLVDQLVAVKQAAQTFAEGEADVYRAAPTSATEPTFP